MDPEFRMHAERTPNPNSIKWVLSRAVADVVPSATFSSVNLSVPARPAGSAAPAKADPLALATPKKPAASDVSAVTGATSGGASGSASGVTADISPLASPILEIDGIESVFLGPNFITVTKADPAEWTELAAPIVAAIKEWAESGASAFGPAFVPPVAADDDEVVAKIKTILERDVRPYVESDGGEISFAGFYDGVVEVVLQGACAGCPSSSITLKMGIEARLKDEIPEVKTVVAI